MAASGSGPVPARVIAQMKRQVDGPVYLPAIVPRGYRFVAWKLEDPTNAPPPGDEWYSVTFKRGQKTLIWAAAVQDEPCREFSSGGSAGVYWGDPGPDGQDVWRCIRVERGRLHIDAFDYRPKPLLGPDQLVPMVRSGYHA
jgi:hypothetical protein